MIEFHKVSKQYPTGQLALYNVNLSMKAGEMAFLTGHSGAGKSTLLKLIAMLERPSSGDIIINGNEVNKLKNKHIPPFRRQIGMIFQNHHLLMDRTIFENVALPLKITGLHHRDIRRRVHAALDKVSLLNKQKENPMMLSAGEQQRVGIARAVVNKPTIILADEPTGNLDPELAQDIMYTFRQFNELGATVLIASHDHGLIEHMQARTIVLQKINA
ncbi:MAG: cell division ATP-binding protein FtsE [Thiotrichaceae bacterium]